MSLHLGFVIKLFLVFQLIHFFKSRNFNLEIAWLTFAFFKTDLSFRNFLKNFKKKKNVNSIYNEKNFFFFVPSWAPLPRNHLVSVLNSKFLQKWILRPVGFDRWMEFREFFSTFSVCFQPVNVRERLKKFENDPRILFVTKAEPKKVQKKKKFFSL